MAFLELVAGRHPGTRFELSGDRQLIGRGSDCDFALDVAAVSRRHAVFYVQDGCHYVEDLGSRNGTLVNGTVLTTPAPLQDGDQVRICDQTFAFFLKEASAVGPALESSTDSSDRSGFEVNLVDDDDGQGTVVATLELGGGGSASWRLSAKPEVKLGAMVEISNNLGTVLLVDEILPKILESLFKIFVQADRGFVIMRSQADAPLIPVATKMRRQRDEGKTRISRTIIEEAMKGRKAILSADAATDERFNLAQSIADFHIRSMICAPMLDSIGEPMGVIQIDTLNQKSRFTDDDLEVLAGVASQAAIAIDNAKMHEQVLAQQALERDLELAQRMQLALLPSTPPKVPGYVFFNYYQAARQVGGDYYDYVSLADGREAVIVGDVAGKGVSAALVMARLSSDVRFTLASEPDVALAITKINTSFARHDWQDKFVTMIVAIVNPHTHQMTLVNAGHMAPLLRRGGEVREIGEEQSGLPIGVSDDYQFESYTEELQPGDFITLFTDGFSEAMDANGDLYGIDRLAKQVGTSAVSVEELGQHILEDVHQFVDGFAQSDDMCLACFGRL